VIPRNVDVKAIEEIYAKKVAASEIVPPKFYKEAKIAIAGKFVGVLEKS
jgi:hypothetical protein